MNLRLLDIEFEVEDDFLEGAMMYDFIHATAAHTAELLCHYYNEIKNEPQLSMRLTKEMDELYHNYMRNLSETLPDFDIYEVSIRMLTNACQLHGGRVEQLLAKTSYQNGILSEEALRIAACEDLLASYDVLKEAWEKENNRTLPYTCEHGEQGNTILHHMREGRISEEKCVSQSVRILSLLPYHPEAYTTIWNSLENAEPDLRKIAGILGVQVEFGQQAEEEGQTPFELEASTSIEALTEPSTPIDEIYVAGHQLDLVQSRLMDNFFFVNLENDPDVDDTDAADLLYACKLLLRPELHRHFPSILEEKEWGRFNNAISTYAILDRKNEQPLLLFDNTIMSSGKDGFLITNKHLYIKGGSTIAWRDVNNIECSSNSILVNKQRISLTWSVLGIQDIKLVEQLLMFSFAMLLAFDKIATSDKLELTARISVNNEAAAVQYSQKILASFSDSDWSRHVVGLSDHPKAISKFRQAVQHYAVLETGEIPLIVFDNTAFGSCKEGCLLTNKKIHIRNTFSKAKVFEYEAIGLIELKGISKDLFINGYEVNTTMISSNEAKVKFCALLNRVRNDLAGFEAEGEVAAGFQSAEAFNPLKFSRELLSRSIMDKDLLRHVFLYGDGPKSDKKFQNALLTYANLSHGEVPLILYDDTAFGSAKNGMLLSTKALYVRNNLSQAVRFEWEEIFAVELRGTLSKELYINNYKADVTLLTSTKLKQQWRDLIIEVKSAGF